MDNFKMTVITLTAIIVILIVAYYISMNSNKVNKTNTKVNEVNEQVIETSKYIYISASQMAEQIKKMDKNEYVILDVRTKQEYDEQRIPNSVLLTLSDIEAKASTVLPNKDIKIYVYCRSGARSEQAAYKLISLGYKNVYDFGGIIDYPYETIKGI
jgi:phage shock protein E